MAAACTEGLDTGFVALVMPKLAYSASFKALPNCCRSHRRRICELSRLSRLAGPRIAFSAAMQVAALAAVVSYFWPDVRGSLRARLVPSEDAIFRTGISVSLSGSFWRRFQS